MSVGSSQNSSVTSSTSGEDQPLIEESSTNNKKSSTNNKIRRVLEQSQGIPSSSKDLTPTKHKFSYLTSNDVKNSYATTVGVVVAVVLVIFFATPPGWFVGAGVVGGTAGILLTVALVIVATFLTKMLKLYIQKNIASIYGREIPKMRDMEHVIDTYKEEKKRNLRPIVSIFTNPLLDIIDFVTLFYTTFICGLSYLTHKNKLSLIYNLSKGATASYAIQESSMRFTSPTNSYRPRWSVLCNPLKQEWINQEHIRQAKVKQLEKTQTKECTERLFDDSSTFPKLREIFLQLENLIQRITEKETDVIQEEIKNDAYLLHEKKGIPIQLSLTLYLMKKITDGNFDEITLTAEEQKALKELSDLKIEELTEYIKNKNNEELNESEITCFINKLTYCIESCEEFQSLINSLKMIGNPDQKLNSLIQKLECEYISFEQDHKKLYGGYTYLDYSRGIITVENPTDSEDSEGSIHSASYSFDLRMDDD